jgi:hypothetical protein
MTEEQAKVLEHAIESWETLTQTKLLGNRQTLRTLCAAEEIKEAFKLDETGVTALLILHAETEAYAGSVNYSLRDMEDQAEEVNRRVQAFLAVRQTLKAPAYASILDNFFAAIHRSMEFYGCLTPEVEVLLKDRIELAYIRRDALRAMEILREDVFATGEPAEEALKFNPGVFLFWNINSLLRIMGNSSSGVSLCVIENQEEANASHFGFAIKCGANLVLLSDKPKFANPEQAILQSSRRGTSHELGRRMTRLRFPYSLLGAWFDKRGDAGINLPGPKIKPAQSEAIKLAEFSSLPADTLIWLAMVFDLIANRTWKNTEDLKEKPLAYTGTMIEQPLSLAEGCQALAIRNYKPLQFKPFAKVDDILADKVTFEVKQTGQNNWMEQRYKDQVPVELLNPLPSNHPQLPAELLPPKPEGLGIHHELAHYKRQIEMSQLREEYWGNAKELQHTHMWVARKNFSTTIARLVQQEFDREIDNVKRWVREHYEANREFWLHGLATGELMLPFTKENRGSSHFNIITRSPERPQRNAIYYVMRSESKPSYYINDAFGGRAAFFQGAYERAQDAFHCYLEPERIGHEMAIIDVDCPEAIALLAGCKVEDLPVFLQHWYSNELYTGNSILTDVDPMEDVTNPWFAGIKPRIYIRFCRSALYRFQRAQGIPKRSPWEAKAK